MKNVAGYDVSRLLAGSFGWLGVIEAASIRVHPLAEVTNTLVFEQDQLQAVQFCTSMQRQYLPLTGTWWCRGLLHVRLSGTANGVDAACQRLGGDKRDDDLLWRHIRDQSHPFFSHNPVGPDSAAAALHRVIVPAACEPMPDSEQVALEWAGGLRWIWHEDTNAVVRWARLKGGWSWRVGDPLGVDPGQLKIMQALKRAFDPDNVFANQVLQLDPASDHAH